VYNLLLYYDIKKNVNLDLLSPQHKDPEWL